MKLLIVESPSKIFTLYKILEKNKKNEKFIFLATYGHIKDLPVKNLGIDLNTFSPRLIFLSDKKNVLKRLRKLSLTVKEVFLATDPDREGEAISYHLYEFISKIKPEVRFKRIDLIEITEHGIKQALKHPREINFKLYEAWLTRRVLDRLIGYLISPEVSKNFKKRLSAGRVQSVALRLVAEREEEIENFVPQTRYFLSLKLKHKDKEIFAELLCKGKVLYFSEKEEAEKFGRSLVGKILQLNKIVEKEEKEFPPLPLKTTTLIELAQKELGFSPKETMLIAQNLYEHGFITYMRTDSVRVSEYAKKSAREYIKELFGEEYTGKGRRIKKGKFVQDAHECIRPTNIRLETVPLPEKEKFLYSLIRFYFILSQMSPAIFLKKNLVFKFIDKELKDYSAGVKFKKLLFDGYLKLVNKKIKENWIEVGSSKIWEIAGYEINSQTTKPPERYTPSSLIKKLESMGIGRPSTYATLLDILFKRNYIVKEGNYLKITELGKEVVKFLKENFSPFVDYEFTAKMENELEKILTGENEYFKTVSEVYRVLKDCLG
jgi:DNA topoisomerase-1